MRRLLDRHLVAAGLLVAVGGMLSGCAENESVLFIKGVIAPDPPDCIYSADSGGTMLMSGIVDKVLANSYQAALLVGNQIKSQGARDQLRTESSRVSITGAEVHVLAEGDELAEFTVSAQGHIDPGSGQEPGYGVVYAELLRPLKEFEAGQVILAKVQVYGQTIGGQDVESSWFRFPIEIVEGDLIAFPAGVGLDGSCDSVEAEEDFTCFPGQDGPTSCGRCLEHPECRTLGGS